jgi:hypothetical protein
VTDTELQDLVAWLDSVRDDPVRFVEEAFDWGKGELENATGPEPWQRWLLEQIRDGLKAPGEAIKIAISSGHGIGKSCVCSLIVLWAISTFPGARAIITASSEAMLMTRLRAELRVWFRRFKGQEFFEFGATALTARDPAHAQTWRADLLAWNENRPEAMAGLHAKDGRLLVLFDEASAIPAPIWDTIEPIVTDARQPIWIATGNPLHPTGRFRDCFEKYSHRWITKHVDSRSISFTNKPQLQRWIEDFGEDSDFVRTRILGEFPRTGSTQFIGPESVDEAMNRELIVSRSDPLVIGVDVARFGDDMSVIYPRKGMDARSLLPLTFRGIPLDKLEDHVVAFCNAHKVQQIFVDGTGLGGGLVDHLRRRGFNVSDVQFGARADQLIDGTRFANKRAEIWGLMRNALKYLCLPNDPALREQLTAPEYTFGRTNDAILLEPKDAMKRRGLPSCDLADALACSFGAEIATLPALADWAQSGLVVSDWNPYSNEAIRGEPLPESRAMHGRYYAPPEEGWEWPRLKSDFE